MVSRRFCGFLLIVMWNLHIVHKALQYGCTRHHGLEVDSMAIGLHGWFKIAPCKREDIYIYIVYVELGKANSLSQHFVETCWLTLIPALQKIEQHWKAAK